VEKKEDTVGRETMTPYSSMGCNRSLDVITLCRIIYLSTCVEYTLMLNVSYHAVKGVKASMLPWIHSMRGVHHRSSHEYLRVVTVREEEKGETVVTTPIG
jgi:hypothetical protein